MSIIFQISEGSTSENIGDFGKRPDLKCKIQSVQELTDGTEMNELACCVYYNLLKHLPAMVNIINHELRSKAFLLL